MSEVPSAGQIIDMARQIQQRAAEQRGRELNYADRGAYSDEEFAREGGTLPGGITGGSSADYAALGQQYAWIVDYFEQSVGPDPEGFEPPVRTMESAAVALGGTTRPLDLAGAQDGGVQSYEDRGPPIDQDFFASALTASNTLSSWVGHAADTFKGNFLGAIPAVTSNQARVIKVLQCAAEANMVLYERARRDIYEIAKKTKTALEFSGGSDGPSLGVVLGVTAGVFTIAAGIATLPAGGAALVVGGATATAGLATTVQAVVTAPGAAGTEEFSIEGHTVDTVLASCVDGVRKVWDHVDAGEDVIIQSLRGAEEAMNGYRSSFLAPRPNNMIEASTRPVEDLWNDFEPT